MVAMANIAFISDRDEILGEQVPPLVAAGFQVEVFRSIDAFASKYKNNGIGHASTEKLSFLIIDDFALPFGPTGDVFAPGLELARVAKTMDATLPILVIDRGYMACFRAQELNEQSILVHVRSNPDGEINGFSIPSWVAFNMREVEPITPKYQRQKRGAAPTPKG